MDDPATTTLTLPARHACYLRLPHVSRLPACVPGCTCAAGVPAPPVCFTHRLDNFTTSPYTTAFDDHGHTSVTLLWRDSIIFSSACVHVQPLRQAACISLGLSVHACSLHVPRGAHRLHGFGTERIGTKYHPRTTTCHHICGAKKHRAASQQACMKAVVLSSPCVARLGCAAAASGGVHA